MNDTDAVLAKDGHTPDATPAKRRTGRPRKNPVRDDGVVSGRNLDTKEELVRAGTYEKKKQGVITRQRRVMFKRYLAMGLVRPEDEPDYMTSHEYRAAVVARGKAAAEADEHIQAKRLRPIDRDRYIVDPDFRAEALKQARSAKEAEKRETSPTTVGDAVKRELAKRELSRRKLLHFIIRSKPNYQAGWFHRDLSERVERFVERIERQESPRLILAVPPRHGKSEQVSRHAPAWVLGKHPDWEIISCSYALSLAVDNSRSAQDIVRSPDFNVLFPDCRIDPRQESAEDWATTAGGGLLAAGVGGPITGRGAHWLNIDDPFKNRAEADSETTRNTVHNWYTSTAYTRLAPGGGVLLTATRWHFDDLTGRLLTEQEIAEKIEKETGTWPEEYDRWEVVIYPAIATHTEKFRRVGEALHPERYNLPALKKIQRTVGPRDWAALYQQTPASEDGEYFKLDTVRYYDTIDASSLDIYAAGDLAIGEKETNDYTVFVIVGVDASDNIYLLDLRRDRWDSMLILDQIFDIHRVWRPKLFGLEEDKIAKSIGPFLDKRIQEEKLYDLAIEMLKIGKRDKQLRARPIQGRMKQGKVFFPKTSMWTAVLVNEMLQFPAGKHDDQVDALAWIGQMLMTMTFSGRKKPEKKSWRTKLHQFMQGVGANSGSAMAA